MEIKIGEFFLAISIFLKIMHAKNNINADFWLVKDAYHVDAMLKYPEEYGLRMKKFFDKHLSN